MYEHDKAYYFDTKDRFPTLIFLPQRAPSILLWPLRAPTWKTPFCLQWIADYSSCFPCWEPLPDFISFFFSFLSDFFLVFPRFVSSIIFLVLHSFSICFRSLFCFFVGHSSPHQSPMCTVVKDPFRAAMHLNFVFALASATHVLFHFFW